jgi:hypothetical protein
VCGESRKHGLEGGKQKRDGIRYLAGCLPVTNDGRKLALDQRLINPLLPKDDNGKVEICSKKIFEIWNDTKERKSTQLVFCDLSTPKSKGEFSVYDDLKESLINKGLPDKEIAFIHDATNEIQKDEMFSKVRKGDIRVLIGSTQKMGAGTNVQDKLIATHDLDCPWKPSDLEQRAGRLIRQGNENEKVKVYRYVTENTFDSYSWQLVENKQRFISQIMTSKSAIRSAEDIDESTLSYAEIKALATGNPLIKEKMELDVQVSKLKMLQSNFLSNKYSLEDKIVNYYPNEIKRYQDMIVGYKEDIKILELNTNKLVDGDKSFSTMIVKGIFYDKLQKEDAGKAILNACKELKNDENIEIGEYKGFKMKLSYDSFNNQFNLNLKGSNNHKVILGTDIFGNISRIDNVLENMQTKLIETIERLESSKQQLKNAESEVNKPFDKEIELKEKIKRLSELDRLLNMNEVTEKVNEISELDRAKEYIMEFIVREYESEDIEFNDLSNIDIAYTTTEDDEHEIQIKADLLNFSLNTYIDDILVNKDQYGSLKDLNDYNLKHLDFDTLVTIDDRDFEKLVKTKNTKVNKSINQNQENSDSEKPSILEQLKKNKQILVGNEYEMKFTESKEKNKVIL